MSTTQHSPAIITFSRPGWLFDSQVISFTTQNRDACIDLMISAIRRAIQYCRTHDTLTATIKEKETKRKEKKEQATDVHESDAELEAELKEAVIATFGSAKPAFDAHSKHGVVGKKEWRKLLKKVMPSLKQEASKQLRKRLPNRMSWVEFSTFIGGSGQSGSSSDKGTASDNEPEAGSASSVVASLPPEVPEVCR